jgi:DNA polymerase-3 subunit delta'
VFDKSILGHAAIRQRLLERLGSNSDFGSLLFVGPDAIGKRRVALELAQRELCFKRTACGGCEACIAFKTEPLPKLLPNLLRIAPEGKAGQIKVDAIRDDGIVEGGVIQWAHQAAPHGCHRWIVIEDAHRLGKSAANMLLKILEEPPPGTFFILLTHRTESVLPTILSRSERVAFGPLAQNELGQIAMARGWEERELPEWAALSSGTLKYIEKSKYARACSQIDAWVSIMEGAAFKDVSKCLLPEKDTELAQSQQTGLALEQLLIVLDEYSRILMGLEGRLGSWAARLQALSGRQGDFRNAFRFALEALRALPRNVAPDMLLRKIALELG